MYVHDCDYFLDLSSDIMGNVTNVMMNAAGAAAAALSFPIVGYDLSIPYLIIGSYVSRICCYRKFTCSMSNTYSHV